MTSHSPPRRRRTACTAIVLFIASFGLPSQATAQITLEALQRDGYGLVPLKRPQPNVLAVIATIDGRKAQLIVDTGWSGDGISLEQSFASALRAPTEGVKTGGRSASGAEIGGMTKTRADQVMVGNVQINNVPVYLGTFKGLGHEQTRRKIGAQGFISAGFLRTCSAVIDLQNLRLYLRPPGTGRRALLGQAMRGAGLAEAPFAVSDSYACVVEVEINGIPTKMLLDTGAFHAGVDERFAPQMKTALFNSRAGAIDAAGVISRTKYAPLRSFKIGDVPVKAPDVRVNKYGFYPITGGKIVGLLGMDILGPNGTVIDFGAQKLYMIPAR